MRQVKFCYLLKCVIPHTLFVDSNDDDMITIVYKDSENNEVQKIHLSLGEYEHVISKVKDTMWVDDMIDEATQHIDNQSLNI